MLVGLELSRPPYQYESLHEPSGTASIHAHRDEVLRRLLAHGLSTDTLLTLLPDWSERIRELADEGTASG